MSRRGWLWITQGLLAIVVGFFVARTLAGNIAQFRSLAVAVHIDPLMLLAAATTVLGTYLVLIEAWRRLLRGWGERLRFSQAAKIWFLSNLGRYLPGKVWSIAGLTVLARRAGVSGWAAAGGALAMQALAVGTGACVVAVAVPGVVAPLQLGAAALAAGTAVAALTWSPLGATVSKVVKPTLEFRALPVGTALLGAAITLVSWMTYGLAFWLLARGMFATVDLAPRTAMGVFAAGYLVGLLALFAPGGLGVRELVFVALLAPTMGGGSAVALTVGSRLLLTVTEAAAALSTLVIGRRGKGEENAFDAREI